MCTVSILRAPWADADAGAAPLWRVMCSRDERLTRPPAAPPFAGGCAMRRVVHPLDPQGRGTWIAATSSGLVFALLNETESDAPVPAGPASRGLVIPLLASSASIDEAADRLGRLRASRFLPFRLLVAGDTQVLEAVSGRSLSLALHAARPRFARTSSSVDAAATRRRRMELFDSLVAQPSLAAQALFHAHQWPEAPGASVLMSRPDARTVSVTTVDVFANGVRLSYRALPAGGADVTELARAA
jgi:hypothetical protein